MNVSLTPQLETFVRQRAESGDYNNASELVREAIRLFKRIEEERAFKLDQLRIAITEGDKAVEMGQSQVFNSEAELDQLFGKL
ncbi:MAG: type II toxin-antitoxin system ParD family antitoxin [Gammaproteobacteria bacterium]|nr:type II toxin-antitoxin system ParD family antitoxin [Gammaproteobacteria bacterium]